jgi:tellurite resistance protein TerC
MEVLYDLVLGKPLWLWGLFFAIVALLLAFDLGVLHRKEHEIGIRESMLLSGGYILIGLCFGGFIWHQLGSEAAVAYVTGFVIEKSLALDNIFVIAMIFGYFGIPRLHQHRVLFWGILGVIVLRAIMIGLGAALVERFGWVLYLFAGFLIFTGVRMLMRGDRPYQVGDSRILAFIRRHIRMTEDADTSHFFVRRPDPAGGRKRLYATPLFLALVMVEFADIIFAVDSVPAIFAITTDPYLVYTSNIFAILGLRALYFALAAMINRFAYLKYALAAVLVFIGGKIFAADMLGIAKIPPPVSLGVTLGILASGILWSLWRTRNAQKVA